MAAMLNVLSQGLTKDSDYYNTLTLGASTNLTVKVQAGVPYVLLAYCDPFCHDIDLTLYDPQGTMIVQDTQTNDRPRLDFTPTQSGDFSLRVTMVRCDNSICHYGVGLFRQ